MLKRALETIYLVALSYGRVVLRQLVRGAVCGTKKQVGLPGRGSQGRERCGGETSELNGGISVFFYEIIHWGPQR